MFRVGKFLFDFFPTLQHSCLIFRGYFAHLVENVETLEAFYCFIHESEMCEFVRITLVHTIEAVFNHIKNPIPFLYLKKYINV